MAESTDRLRAALADRYTIERELGAGGMATVYLAHDLKHQRSVAIKVLRPELAAVLGAERFVQEITTTAALQHPHILPLFDSGTADGFLYYVMPFIDGETLRSKLDRETQLGIDEAVKITVAVADALDYAHRQGVIHRDIKPENILLHDGRPMVADFGIALALSAAAGGRMTETGMSLGTPHYMSPEQATAEKEITARSDLYSLASVLYEMLTGTPPHTGASAQQIIMRIVTDTARPVTELRKSVPANVAAAVSQALEKLPADRFASAAEFAAALQNSAFTTTAADGTVAGAMARPWHKDRRTLALLGILAVMATALGISVAGPRGLSSGSERAEPVQFTFTPPTGYTFGTTRIDLAVSPDGRLVAFQARGEGTTRLFLRRMDGLDATPLITMPGDNPALIFSPDGRWIAFLILPLYDSGEADGFLFYVMPYEEGQSLRERLEKETELPIRDVVRLLHDVADALTHAHQHGLVHRDIKPENVMLSGRHALVTDFGVAKAVSDATGRQKLTTIGVALGTPVYMAPEQAAADPHIDHRADIYALGILGYELLTGRPPFTGLTPQAVLAAQVTQPPVPVTNHRPTVPPALATLVMKCLEKKAADRYQSAEELLPLLEALGTPSGGTTPIGTAPFAAVPARADRRPLYGAGAVLLLAVLGWAGWRATRPAPLSLTIANIRQVTREPEAEIHVAISPDGHEVAYESGYVAATHIVVRDVSGGRPFPLTGDWQGSQVLPKWMPDGRDLVFTNLFATVDHGAGTWKLPRLGGQAVTPDSADRLASSGGVTLLVRGDTLVAIGRDGRETVIRIGLQQVHSLAWRPDGGAVAYVVGNGDYVSTWGNVAPSTIWVTPIGGTPVRVTDSTSLNVSPTWLPDGTLLFVSNRDGARDIYAVRLDRSGATRERPVRLTTGLEAYSVSVSADGRTAAYDRFTVRRNIYAIPIPKSGGVSLRDTRPITTGNQTIENLGISADGKWLVFDSNIEGNQQIFVIPATGGEPRRVTRDAGDDFSPDFSPDGRQITFHSTRNATRDIYVINADGSGEQRLTSDAEQSYHPAFSPDGLSIAYGNASGGSSIDLLHRTALDAPWQGPKRLPIDSGFAPRWSRDGSLLVYVDRGNPGGIGVTPLGGPPQLVIPAGTAGLRSPGVPEWSADGKLIYFRAYAADGVEGVYQVPTAGGTPRLLLRFDDPSLAVHPNASVTVGNGMFYFAVGQIESDIYVMDLVGK